jgi:hypothetical protein
MKHEPIHERMTLAAIQPDGVQLFKQVRAQLGCRDIALPLFVKACATESVMRHLQQTARVGDELDVVLSDARGNHVQQFVLDQFTKTHA